MVFQETVREMVLWQPHRLEEEQRQLEGQQSEPREMSRALRAGNVASIP